jgi:PQQ-dependent dehydrogenase (methanol/ethanol family)
LHAEKKFRRKVVAPRNIPPPRTQALPSQSSTLDEGGTLRLFRMLVPVALVALALAMVGTAGASSAIAPAPAFTPQLLSLNSGDDWLTVGGGLSDQRHSTLTQINASNISGLKLAWTGTFGLPTAAAAVPEEGAAIAYQGTLYMPNGLNAVQAIDGTTGKALWNYTPVNDNPALLPANRGLAIGDGKVFEGQNDGNIVALDQQTGQPVWKTKVGDPTDGIQFTSAPVYYQGMVIEGASGGDWGGRSFALALDAKTGAELWRWYVAPSPGSLGSGSWGINEWQRGGGAIWIYPSIDITTGLLYLVTGNPVPWNGRGPGSNLWSDSIVALHVQTGQFAWGFQTVHHDIWDYDVTNPPTLFDLTYGTNASPTPAMGVASKTGWVYLLNRVTGKPILGIAEKKVPQLKGAAAKYANLSKTQPYPVGDAFTSQCSTRKQWSGKAPDGKPYIVGCIFTPYAYVKGQSSFLASTPAAEGGVDWQPSAYDPATHYQYLCSITGAGGAIGAIPNAEKTIVPGQLSLGVNFGAPSTTPDQMQLIAMDMLTNKVAWKVTQPPSTNKKVPSTRCSGVLSTPGLVFAGQENTKQLGAYDPATGKNLWLSSPLQTATGGPPVTYTANGKQYIVVLGNAGLIYGFTL